MEIPEFLKHLCDMLKETFFQSYGDNDTSLAGDITLPDDTANWLQIANIPNASILYFRNMDAALEVMIHWRNNDNSGTGGRIPADTEIVLQPVSGRVFARVAAPGATVAINIPYSSFKDERPMSEEFHYIPLKPEELSAFKWRHPLIAVDIAMGWEIEGENVYDDTLNGWILYKQGVWYWTERNNQPKNVGYISQIGDIISSTGTTVATGTAKAVTSIVTPLIILGIIILIIQSGWLKGKLR